MFLVNQAPGRSSRQRPLEIENDGLGPLEGAPQGLLDLELELVLVPNEIEDLSWNEIEGPQNRRFAHFLKSDMKLRVVKQTRSSQFYLRIIDFFI